MRPIAVELAGFSTFREKTDVLFGDADLVAFVGPTGSGKSSIIDAITFALYGSVARYGDARLVAPIINQASNEARVRLDFEVAGRTYVAVRVVRRTKTGASTKEARLELLDADEGESPVLASSAKEVTEAVEELLGLDFAQFTRTVVLPQGEFAEFLKDDPASRQRLLRRLLDLEIYSRMGSLARDRAKEASQKAEVIESQVARYAEITPASVVEAKRKVAAVSAFEKAASAHMSSLTTVEEKLVQLREAVGSIDADIATLTLVKVPDELSESGSELADARASLDKARAELTNVRTKRDAAETAAADAGEVRVLETQVLASERVATISAELETLAKEQEDIKQDEARTKEAVAEASLEAERCLTVLTNARVGADAAAWIANLERGEPCPVCRQTVVDLPDHDPSAELAAAEKDGSAAQKALKSSETRLTEISREFTRVTARLDERQLEHQKALAALEGAPHDLSGRLLAAKAAVEALTDVAAELKTSEEAVVVAERQVAKVDDVERGLRTAFGEQRDAVAALTPPTPGGVSLADDWGALGNWAQTLTEKRNGDRVTIADDGKAAAKTKAEVVEQLSALAAPLDLDPDPAQLDQNVARAQATAEAEVARLTERLAEVDGWRADLNELQANQQVNETLGRQLSATGFERWLLVEALDDLVLRASVRLRELSSGQYSLGADEGVFLIIDHNNADEPRDVRTLSGGETFLASLALALALADSIAELAPVDAPRLGSMFLDEGFGTLDGETLDVVASAIEELSASGRLVGIVTHIEALAERMPVQIQVRKGPTSSTIERVSQ